jgi:hypothetical protein
VKLRIFEFNLYNNEEIIAKIKIDENKKWIEKTVITECDYTFSYIYKGYNFKQFNEPSVIYKKISGKKCFKKPGFGISGVYPFFRYKNQKWKNDGIHRNASVDISLINDNDIVVISDIDEIVNPLHCDEILGEARKRGIVTFKMFYTQICVDI